MNNIQVARMLADIADLLDIKGDDPFKIRAYRRAAQSVSVLAEPIEEYHAGGRLTEIPNIGKALAGKIAEKLDTGTCTYLEKLKAELPPGLLEMLDIPGVGARTVALIYREIGVRNLDELEQAARAGRLRSLPKLGEKTEQNILNGIPQVRNRRRRTPLWQAWPAAADLAAALSRDPSVRRVEVAGSLRRYRDTVGDLDLVAASEDPLAVMQAFTRLPGVAEVLVLGETKTSIRTETGLQVDLRVVRPDQFATALHHFTGSAEHNTQLRHHARSMGIRVSEYGLFRRPEDGTGDKGCTGDKDDRVDGVDGEAEETAKAAEGERLPVADETELYRHLRLDFIPPELREGSGEIEAAAHGRLPDLVELSDIRGDLHIHTTASDGLFSVEEMARAARERGYDYVAITDHSKSLAMVHGLDEARVKEQAAAIRELNASLEGFRVLSGIEVDILPGGGLDLPDGCLADLDVVIASIHSGFRQSAEELTARMVGAVKNDHVDIIGHPTGRLIGRREPYPLDTEALFEAAARTGTVMEINSSVERLDLSDALVRRAKDYGLPFAISTDAHDQDRLEEMFFGVKVARRAWLSAADVVNTREAADLLAALKG